MGKKIVIIGGGVAGLSSGIYGQMNGFETEIFEMHSITGGQCTAWERKGYRFDYCLHWLVGTSGGAFHDLWYETNILNDKTTVINHDIHSVIINESGEEFIIYSDISRWEKSLIDMAPEDKSSIRKMCNDMRKASAYQPLNKVRSLGDFVGNSVSVIRMIPAFSLFFKYAKYNSSQYFKKLNFKNQKLSYFLDNIFAGENFSALAFLMMLGWFNQKNAGYILGGSLPLARRMEDKYRLSGGKVNTGKKVRKIIVEDNAAKGIELTDGTVIRSDYVISAADGHSTIYEMLGGKFVSEKITSAYESWPLFTPLVQVSFGIKNEIENKYPITSVIADGKNIGSTKLLTGYSLMNYSFDPTMAPQGKNVIVLRFESPWEIWKNMTESDYKTEKEQIKNDAIKLLESQFPSVKGNIEVVDVATPLTNTRFTGVWKGAFEGFMPSQHNITKNIENRLPHLKNFYMAGQWLYPGGGIPPSVMSGKTAVRNICRSEKKEFRVI